MLSGKERGWLKRVCFVGGEKTGSGLISWHGGMVQEGCLQSLSIEGSVATWVANGVAIVQPLTDAQ